MKNIQLVYIDNYAQYIDILTHIDRFYLSNLRLDFCIQAEIFFVQKIFAQISKLKEIIRSIVGKGDTSPAFAEAKGGEKMDNSFEEHKQHTFDCFCKKMLRNEMRDYYAYLNKCRKHEISFSELTAKEIEQLSVCDEYFADEQHVFRVLGNEVIVKDDFIAEALKSLSENRRDIILLSYFLDMTDREIGEKLNLIGSTVQYRRKSTLRPLKKFMEEKANE